MRKLMIMAMMVMSTVVAMAQVNPKAGYVITLERDTLWGELDLRTDEYNMEKCNFKQNGRQRWVTFKPEEIEAYRFTGSGKMYVSKFLNIKGVRTLCFAEYMVKGTMNLYYVPVDERYYFENEDGKIVEYVYEFDDALVGAPTAAPLQKLANNAIKEREDNVRPLARLVQKSKSASELISIYKMNREDLIKVAQAYHKDVCTSNEDCIVYSYNAKADKTKLNFRVFAGGMFSPYKLSDDNSTTYVTPALGVGLDIALPKVAKGLSAQVQLIYCMNAKMSGTLIKEVNGMDVENKYDAHTSHLLIEAGALYSIGDAKKVHPVVRLGLAADKVREVYDCDRADFTPKYDKNSILFGGYAGAGVEIPVGKIAIDLDVTAHLMSKCRSKCMLMATAGVRL